MATYAMICDNKVIEVLHEQEMLPKWPPDPSGNTVSAIVCPNEATRDWAYNPETGEVFEPTYEPPEEPEVIVDEYEQYYSIVNAALNGGV